MDIIYVVVIVVAALIYGYAAVLNFVGAESVKVVADRVRVSQKWMIPFGVLLASGALGLLIGLAVPVVGLAAATGLVVVLRRGSERAHPSTRSRGRRGHWLPPAGARHPGPGDCLSQTRFMICDVTSKRPHRHEASLWAPLCCALQWLDDVAPHSREHESLQDRLRMKASPLRSDQS